MPEARLIIIKHSAPQVITGIAPENWVLSPEGQRRCKPLGDRLAPYHPAAIFTSEETKAVETGKLLAAQLSIPSSTAAGLQEHDRSNVPQMQASQFISMMELAFRNPGELSLGKETVQAAAARVDKAVSKILFDHPNETLAIISHGTVLAQWLAPKLNEKPFELWRKMGLPSMVVLDLPAFNPVERINQF